VKKLILSQHKHLCLGDFLIDDKLQGQGQESFQGKLIHFGSSQYPNWQAVNQYLESQNKPDKEDHHNALP